MVTLRSVAAWLALSVAVATKDGTGNGVSKSTYAATDPVRGKDFLLTYFGNALATATDECTDDLCECTDEDGTSWEIQQGRVALNTEDDSQLTLGDDGGPDVSSGFGLHLVNLTQRLTTGGNTVGEIEQIFADKLDDMSRYDAFMDYSVGLYTTDLDQYITALDKDSVDHLTSTWVDSDSRADWTSITVLVPGTHMVVEIYSDNSTYGLQRKLANQTHIETRLGATQAAVIKAHANTFSATSDYLYATRISRGTADLDAIDNFYQNVMGATLDIDSSTDQFERHCFKYFSSSTVDVCFTKRDESATSSDFSVADMEAQMNAVHANLLINPMCGVDKWLDNHHAYDALTTSTSSIVEYLDSDAGADIYYYCSPASVSGSLSGLHYIIDPTGWGIQLDMEATEQPAGCSDSARQVRLDGDYNPACDLGEC